MENQPPKIKTQLAGPSAARPALVVKEQQCPRVVSELALGIANHRTQLTVRSDILRLADLQNHLCLLNNLMLLFTQQARTSKFDALRKVRQACKTKCLRKFVLVQPNIYF